MVPKEGFVETFSALEDAMSKLITKLASWNISSPISASASVVPSIVASFAEVRRGKLGLIGGRWEIRKSYIFDRC